LRIGIWLFRHHGGKVVFWGRFVSVLRTYAAFLAGANRMSWPRFLFFNTAGGILWAIAFGLGYYLFGDVLERLGTALDIGLAALGILAVVGFVLWMRKREASLQARADAEIRGPVAEELGGAGSGT
jgi:membrane protein DedA with SNARE-associated domain